MSSDTWQGNHVTSQRKAAKHEVVSCGYKPLELCSTRIHSLDPPQLLRQLHHSLHTAVKLHPFRPTALGRAAFCGLKPPSPQKLHCLPSGKIRHTIYSSCRRCAAEQPSLCYLWAQSPANHKQMWAWRSFGSGEVSAATTSPSPCS